MKKMMIVMQAAATRLNSHLSQLLPSCIPRSSLHACHLLMMSTYCCLRADDADHHSIVITSHPRRSQSKSSTERPGSKFQNR